MQPKIDALRAELDALDTQLVRLWERRVAITDEIGRQKARHGAAVRDSAREQDVISRCQDTLCDKSLAGDLAALYETVFSISRRRQEEMR